MLCVYKSNLRTRTHCCFGKYRNILSFLLGSHIDALISNDLHRNELFNRSIKAHVWLRTHFQTSLSINCHCHVMHVMDVMSFIHVIVNEYVSCNPGSCHSVNWKVNQSFSRKFSKIFRVFTSEITQEATKAKRQGIVLSV